MALVLPTVWTWILVLPLGFIARSAFEVHVLPDLWHCPNKCNFVWLCVEVLKNCRTPFNRSLVGLMCNDFRRNQLSAEKETKQSYKVFFAFFFPEFKQKLSDHHAWMLDLFIVILTFGENLYHCFYLLYLTCYIFRIQSYLRILWRKSFKSNVDM